ncbi:MAG: hypothetical protein KKD01_20020 [Proteobacteria bacterium]|nr:hypothetical protein [Pseudomonadota bacterium]
MTRYAAKTDANQQKIIDALRAAGATVECLSAVGSGCPDIAVGYQGFTYFMEVKTNKGKLTPDQVEWHASWRGQVAIVRSVDEALELIGVM